MGKVNIGEEAFKDGAYEMEGGLKEVMGGVEIGEGEEGRIPGNGETPKGSVHVNIYGVTARPKSR